MSALSLLVPSLKRFVAVAGQFDTTFPTTTNTDLVGVLADGFAESKSKGLFSTSTLDLSDYTVTPDLETGAGSLVVLFAGTRMLVAQIANRKSHTRYKAGPVESEVDFAASVLVELLRGYENEKKAIIAAAATYGGSDAFWMADMAIAKAVATYSPAAGGWDYSPYLGG